MSVESTIVAIILGVVEKALAEKSKAAALRRARLEAELATQRILVEHAGDLTLAAKRKAKRL